MLNKLAVLLLTLTALSGCGYKGALYIPDEPSQNTPPSSNATLDASFEDSFEKNDQASNTQSTALKFVASSTRRATLINTPLTSPLTKFGDSN